jgi:nitroreductase
MDLMSTQTQADAYLATDKAIQERRSVKQYDPSVRLTPEEIQTLLSLTMLSPTSFNIQNWRFVVVDDEAVKLKLREAAWNQAQVTDASHVVLICADLKAWQRDPGRYWVNAPAAVRDALVPMIGQFYSVNAELERDEAMRSVGIAAQTFMLAAKSMGYDTCPMIGFDPVKVAEIINLPEDHVIGLMVVVGKASTPARERGGQLPYKEVVFANRFV